MQDCKVSEACLLGTTGYGYNDLGRDTLEMVRLIPFGTLNRYQSGLIADRIPDCLIMKASVRKQVNLFI